MPASANEAPRRLPRWPALLAGLVPLTLYIWTAGGTSYWLDSAEFTAAAIDLDIPHPPGHPLASLWGYLFTLLPLGPLPFRVALSQAFATALALACVQRAIERSVAFVGLEPAAARVVGVGGAWLAGASYGFWFQSVRAEVYALQAMLVCFGLERLSLLATPAEGRAAASDARAFYQATLAVGLGLANHHFISVLALPAFAWAFVQLTRAQRLRPLAWGLATGLFGLCGYAYLPLRAARLPPMDLGHPVTPEALAWVVSARVYAKELGSQTVAPLAERFADIALILLDNLQLPALLLLLLGGYALVRSRRTWPLAWMWLVTALVNLPGRAFLGPVRSNPDVLGYMMPGFAAALALAACGLATLAAQARSARVQRGIALAWLLFGALQLARGRAEASLASFQAPDLFDEVRYRALPDRACVVLSQPQTAFRHFGAEAVERLRPDVAMVPLPFLDYGSTGEQLARKQPELAPTIRAYREAGELSHAALTQLVARRPVLVELDGSLTLPLYPYLIPSGLYYQLLPRPPTNEQRARAAQQREALFSWFYATIGTEAQELETKRHLLWLHYTDALYFAHHGLRNEARRAARRGLALESQVRELGKLAAALDEGEGALDIRPFLLGPP